MESCVNHTTPTLGDEDGLNLTLSGVINQVALPVVCAFGIVGNILNLAILTRRKLKKSFRTLEQAANLCLISLTVSDLLFCISASFTAFLPANNIYDQHGISLQYAVYSVGFINVFIMESTMLTVAMSLERYLAICFPLRQDIYLTTRRIKVIIVLTFLFSWCFNIPVFWRNEIVMLCNSDPTEAANNINMTFDPLSSFLNDTHVNILDNAHQNFMNDIPNVTQTLLDDVTNVSFTQQITIPHKNASFSTFNSILRAISTLSSSPFSSSASSSSSELPSLETNLPKTGLNNVYSIRIVPLGGSHVYDISYRVIWAFVGNFIPLILLLYFNICLCRKIYRSYQKRRQLGRQVQARSSSHILTLTLVAIVVLFFILVAPSEVTLQISHLTSSQDTPLYRNIEAVLNLMQSINFSVNFILYCIISPYFRKTLKYMMMCGCYNIYQVSRNSKKEFDTSLL